jgi:hypothetical protein
VALDDEKQPYDRGRDAWRFEESPSHIKTFTVRSAMGYLIGAAALAARPCKTDFVGSHGGANCCLL